MVATAADTAVDTVAEAADTVAAVMAVDTAAEAAAASVLVLAAEVGGAAAAAAAAVPEAIGAGGTVTESGARIRASLSTAIAPQVYVADRTRVSRTCVVRRA